MQPFEGPSVRYWSKEINGTLTGGQKKYFFLIRDIDDAAMAAAPAESGRFVVLRSPRGRLGSVLDMGNRLHRMPVGRYISVQVLTSARTCAMIPPSFQSRALGEHQEPAHAL